MAEKESKRVGTLKSFIEWAEQFNDGEYVFRGVSNEEYQIEASTYRRLKDKDGNFKKQEDGTPEKLLEINEEILEDARRQGHGGDMEDLDLLAELQHRGAATCLIDFTKNPLVALWMACREGSRGSENGKIYAVDISSQITFQPVTSKLAEKENIDYFFLRDKNNRYQLYQWQPKYQNQNSRMLAQQSIFLFGGAEIESAAECLIFKNSKQDIRNSLEKLAGITEGILFPDFDGFASQRAQNKTYIEPDPQYYLQRGLDAYREGKIDEAIDYYSKGILLKPGDQLLSHLYLARAFVYDTMSKYDLAIKDYDEVIRLDPNNVGVYNNRGAAKAELGQYEEAIDDYNELIRLIPDFGIAYNNRGVAKAELGQYEEAIDNYDEAIRLNPDYANTYYNRGVEKYELGRYEEAIDDYNEAIRLNPDNMDVYNNRGAAKSALGMHEEAMNDYDEAIRLNPDNMDAYNNRGNANSALGRYEEAIADYDEAIRLKSEDANLYERRGNSKSKLERYGEAISDFDEAVRLNPHDAATYQLRGLARFELRQYDETIVDCNEVIRLNPDDVPAYLLRGLAESELGQLSEAQQDFQMALQLAEQTENANLIMEITIQLDELKSRSGESQ